MHNQLTNKIFLILLMPVFLLQWSYSQKISPSVRVSSGAINGVVIEKNGEKLVVYGDPNDEINYAEMVLLTHFRRDVVWAVKNLVQEGSLAVAPAEERPYFTSLDSIWTEFASTRFHDYYCQTTKFGVKPMEVASFVKGGEIFKWQDMDIKVLNTPGYTRGSVSYIADIDNKRFAFVGDLIYGDGKIFDLYSFQDSLENIGGYHGYATRLGQLISSLQLIAEHKPDFIIPSRGPIIKDPDSSIQKLIQRVRAAYQNYLSISSYRWYYPERMNTLSEHVLGPSVNVDWMPFSPIIQDNPPSWYMHFNNSKLVFAEDSSAFLIDCGSKGGFENLLKLKQSGRMKSLDGIFITHYHDDHTNFINDVVKVFECPVYVTSELQDILEYPGAYNMPCLPADSITDLIVLKNGEKIIWKDFTLTSYFFPGQTLYHGAVLFEKTNGESIFFIGDSFTPAGIDDYCLLNRNLLHRGTGYLYCIDILRELPGNVLLTNQHVKPVFAFSRQHLEYMTKVLLERKAILKELFPWDNVNYGVDEQWVRVYPYGQKANPGQTVDFSVKIFNHSNVPKTFILELNVPDGYSVEPVIDSLLIDPLSEGERRFKLMIPENVLAGVSIITVNIRFDNWDLREWSESLIEISSR